MHPVLLYFVHNLHSGILIFNFIHSFDSQRDVMSECTTSLWSYCLYGMKELSSLEEKMEYQLEERTRDMQDMLESCQTKVSLMVHWSHTT